MKKSRFYVLAALSGMLLAGCTNEIIDDSPEREAFAQAFVKEFGVPAEGHTFSMAKQAEITVRTSVPTDIKVVGNVGGKRYLFAQWDGVTNGQKITFDVPSDLKNVLVLTDEKGYPVNLGGTVNLDAEPATSMAKSRDGETFNPNSMPAGSEIITISGVTDPEYNQTDNLYMGRIPLKSDMVPVDKTQPDMGDWWRSDIGSSVKISQEALQQLVTTGKSAAEISTFYNAPSRVDPTEKRFKQTNFVSTANGPSLYISYMRKPTGYNYILGLMIGNESTLDQSTKIYKVPLLNTANMNKPVRYYTPKNTDKLNWRGVYVVIHFDGDGYYKAEATNHMDYYYNYSDTYTDAFKQQFSDMADLYQAKVLRTANDPVSMAGDTDAANPLQAYTTETAFAYYSNFKKYLHNKCEALKSDPTYGSKVHDLHDFKAMLAYNGGIFDYQLPDDDKLYLDYPEVIRVDENTYQITYQMSLAQKYDERMDNGDATRGSFFEPTRADNHTVYLAPGAWTKLPAAVKGNQLCYYIEWTEGPDNGKIVTTYDENQVKTNEIYYTDTQTHHRGHVGTDTYTCWDINNDGVYDDVVFSFASAGGGRGTIYDNYTWFLACEDLGSVGDNDYNDIIVSFNYSTSGSNIHESLVNIKPMAAGGIYPAYMMVTDHGQTGIIGKEIHEWLGATNTGEKFDFINTTEDELEPSAFNAPVVEYRYNRGTYDGKPFSLAEIVKTQALSQYYVKFWVLVDRNNQIQQLGLAPTSNGIKWLSDEEYSTINALDGVFKINNVPLSNDANVSDVNIPLIICVGSDWEWPKETKNIKDAYLNFKDWINHPSKYFNEDDGEDIKRWYGLKGSTFVDGINRDNVVKRQK